ncbi:MAG: HAD family hydrolase [Phycisphaeraceae bacterium]|nr:HAD family hydrolase [Phycisphaeraceae bacterium]
MLKAALFDLDDTLSDHSWSSRCGVEALGTRWPELRRQSLDALTALHLSILNQFHQEILAGRETAESARPKRYRAFLTQGGMNPTEPMVAQAMAWYQEAYAANRRAVPGAREVLALLRGRKVTTAVLTNHHDVQEQWSKIEECGIAELVDHLFVSAQIGFTKPDPRAFRHVMQTLDVLPDEAVMIGDSLAADIEGADRAGIRSIWLNRTGSVSIPPPSAVTVTSLAPAQAVLDLIGGMAF